jgi:hypothetical protein
MRDCQTRLAVPTSTPTPPLARSTSADRPAAPDTAPLPFYLLLLPSPEETKSDSLCPGGCAPRDNAPHIAATLAAMNAPQTESASTDISFAICKTNGSASSSIRGRPTRWRILDPSNLLAMSFDTRPAAYPASRPPPILPRLSVRAAGRSQPMSPFHLLKAAVDP